MALSAGPNVTSGQALTSKLLAYLLRILWISGLKQKEAQVKNWKVHIKHRNTLSFAGDVSMLARLGINFPGIKS